MTYTSLEESAQSGRPVEAYEFVGTYMAYRYTNADQPLTFFGNVYHPAAITREEAITGDQSQDGIEMVIEIPQTSDIVQDYAFSIAPPDLDLTVYRCHIGLNFSVDPIVFWKGPVTGFNVEEDRARIRVPSILENVFIGNMPNYFFHQSCNHTLFDSRCGVSKAANTTTTTVTAINGGLITVASDGVADDVLKGGMISVPGANEKRLILSNVADVLTVFFPFSRMQVGDSVELSKGCDHSFATCKDKFNNGRRFGGFPYIPKDNPFVGDLS